MMSPAPESPDAPLSVLVVEDSPADALLLKESLREAVARGELTLHLVRSLSDAKAELRRPASAASSSIAPSGVRPPSRVRAARAGAC